MRYTTIQEYITTMLGDINAHIFLIRVKDILPIYYVAVRGKDNEAGAVQRVLNRRRISSIRDFILDGNMFFNMFILNWVDSNYPIKIENGQLKIPQVASGAQVIDGQHRLEGLKDAYEIRENIGEQQVVVLMTQGLSTPQAARIFLNINTEQKPVPSSLVYDLFGEIKDKNYYVVRATDIATKLHEDPSSPYYQCIKLPGSAQGIGKVDLSTVVNALKQFTKDGGSFNEYNLKDFESQYKVICNFFNVIKNFYDNEGNWLKATNPFMTNAGCYAGIDFLCTELISKCVDRRSFEETTIRDLLQLQNTNLLYKEDLKNVQGKEQRNRVYQYLKQTLLKDIPSQNEYKF
ncbi:MAG: DGQHR domain-containing protein [Eubacteriales bacterium]